MRPTETAEMLLRRASLLQEAGRELEAIHAYQEALALAPEAPNSWYNLGWLQRRARRFEAALASYGEALKHGVDQPEEVHLNRGVILADHLGRSDEAEAELKQALALNPDYVPALLNLGNLHEDRGNRAAARAVYERALAVDPANRLALARVAGLAEIDDPEDPMVARLRHALAASGTDPLDRADLGFALGRALDAAGAYDEAAAAYRDANRASRAAYVAPSYDRVAAEAFVDRLLAAFPAPASPVPDGAGQSPIFICGMFRSGSTLAEQILARHHDVRPGGELDLLPALIAERLQPYPEAAGAADPATIIALRDAYLADLPVLPSDAVRVTDKRPDNFLHIGLIKALFPDARIVHTVRDPRDNMLSIWFLHLDPAMTYAFELEDIAHWQGQYRRVMAHWRALYGADMIDFDYDALVADPRPNIERLLAFCGLGWDEACLSFHKSVNPVRTASAWQVREPLYRRSSGRWRNYAGILEEFGESS